MDDPVHPLARGTLRKTAAPGSVVVGQHVRFTIHVTALAMAAGTAGDHAALSGVPNATASAAVRIGRAGPVPPPPVTG